MKNDCHNVKKQLMNREASYFSCVTASNFSTEQTECRHSGI
ncbi:hypothetical protein [Sideroxydans sp. CL21]|nr:hypothetical protein [Sideroxydans sp. CL21]